MTSYDPALSTYLIAAKEKSRKNCTPWNYEAVEQLGVLLDASVPKSLRFKTINAWNINFGDGDVSQDVSVSQATAVVPCTENSTFMPTCTSQCAPYSLEVPPPAGSPDIPDITEGSDSNNELPLIEKKLPPIPTTKSAWLADAADLFVLLCSFLLTTASIVLVFLVFLAQTNNSYSFQYSKVPPILQRAISSLSLTITSAVLAVAGKRYVLFKLARGGLRSQRVAVYSNPTIGNLARYLVLHGAELPLLGLSAVWVLALVTSLTVNDSWEMGPISSLEQIAVPFGPLNRPASGSSWVVPALEQLTFVMSSWCLGLADAVGLIQFSNTTTIPIFGTAFYYPPLPVTWSPSGDYSFSTTSMLNGFNISLDHPSSVPSTAQNLSTCFQNSNFLPILELWSDGSDNQTLSIVAVAEELDGQPNSIIRINATAIIMGGTLSSYNNRTEFTPNGTSWPNVMSTGNQWAQDIISIVCNATLPQNIGTCPPGLSLSHYLFEFDRDLESLSSVEGLEAHWGSVLNMALGAYSSAMLSPSLQNATMVPNVPEISVQITWYGVQFTATYAIYILLANIVASIAVLIVVVMLRLASCLGPDFLNSTRLLLDPLKNPELFNASLQTTVDALANPYMRVAADNMYLFAGEKTTGGRWRWFTMFSLRKRSHSD